MTRKQIAFFAGVTVRTLSNWLRPHQRELEALGMQPRKILLPPKVVKFIFDTFGIDK